MKKLLYLTPLLFIMNSCYSQNQLVEYYFSKEVNTEIDRYIDEQLEANNDLSFYLTLYRETKFESSGNYRVVIGTINKEDSNTTVTNLVKASGRYYLYKKNQIPVVFDYDFAFAKHGEDKKGRPVRSHVIQHSYLIEFTPIDGKIVRTEN